MRKSWDVFLSYSTKDREICESLLADLEQAGFHCWHDRTRIGGGERLRERIEEGLRGSSCVVILLSRHSVKSRWVLNELDAAMLREIRERNTVVIPVIVGRLRDSEIPPDLQGKHYIDLRFSFRRRYEQRREVLLRSVELVTTTGNGRQRRVAIMGEEAMAFLYAKSYGKRPVTRIRPDTWKAIVDVFAKPVYWRGLLHAAALKSFREKYGFEGFSRLLRFVIDMKRLDVVGGFTEEEFEDAMHEAEWFVILTSVHEHARSIGRTGLEFSITRQRKLRYRVVGPAKGESALPQLPETAQPNPRMQPTDRGGPTLRSGVTLRGAKQLRRPSIRARR
jgi:hypothetical protein